MNLVSEPEVTVYRSPDPGKLFAYSPGLARLPSGRLVATLDLGGPGAASLEGETGIVPGAPWPCQGRIFTSDDGGLTWQPRGSFPFMHARPFQAGGRVYILGHAGDLMVIASDDAGETWSAPLRLTQGESWHQAPCNVHYASGCIYLVMEKRVAFAVQGWPVSELAPVLMRGREGDDLTRRENWTFATELSFREASAGLEAGGPMDGFGVPFYPAPYPTGSLLAPGRACAPPGWLETNVVQFSDPDHVWHDPAGRTFHLWMRAHTGGTGNACIAQVVEAGPEPGTGPMRTGLVQAPSGKTMLYVPCPGGQMKFHVVYDPQERLYWLLSTQATDSMLRPERLPAERFSLPNNERRRLQLHFSRNMIDWCFAGLVAAGPVEKASRHYASMVIDGGDLCILSRSGDEDARSAHDGNLILFHRVQNFRGLVY